MDFFAEQDKARLKTKVLVLMFITAVLLIIVSINSVVLVAYFMTVQKQNPLLTFGDFLSTAPIFQILLFSSSILFFIILTSMIVKFLQLRRGGASIAEMLGGTPIDLSTKDFYEKRFINVVDEIAIASGSQIPGTYILYGEQSINAFAAGYTQDSSIIAVTEGCLKKLTRDELQGVVAHEFSHILNGDSNLNIKLICVLAGILSISYIGFQIIRSSGRGRSRNTKNSGQTIFIGLALVLIGSAGLFFGNIIKASISRRREFLADASAVQFTRNPFGIGGALNRIRYFNDNSQMHHEKAQEISHMYFNSFRPVFLTSLFETHPPLNERISRINPSILNQKPKPVTSEFVKGEKILPPKEPHAKFNSPLMNSMAAVDSIGHFSENHINKARSIIQSIPEELYGIIESGKENETILFSLLLDRQNKDVLKKQCEYLKQLSACSIETLNTCYKALNKIGNQYRVPIITLTLPSLEKYSQSKKNKILSIINNLIIANKHISLFEFAVKIIVESRLNQTIVNEARKIVIKNIASAQKDLQIMLSALARHGADNEETAIRAYSMAKDIIDVSKFTLLTKEMCSFEKLQKSIWTLRLSAPQIKKKIISCCAKIIIDDAKVTYGELELMRAISSGLLCPMPILLHENINLS